MMLQTRYSLCLDGDVLKIGFGSPASNDQLVHDVEESLDQLQATGRLRGKLLKINGPTSIPLAFVLAHRLAHLYGAIAVYDPKLSDEAEDKYIVVISHTPQYQVGGIISE